MLPEAAELAEIQAALLAPGRLPGLWQENVAQASRLRDEIPVKMLFDFFSGTTVVQVDKGGYQEPVRIPKAAKAVVDAGITTAVENGILWLLSGPASLLAEPDPPGVLNENAMLCSPPGVVTAAAILPENLPDAWKDGASTALYIATALSMKAGKTLPWKTVRDAIGGALQARFLSMAEASGPWPCEYPAAQQVRLAITTAQVGPGGPVSVKKAIPANVLVASAELEPGEIMELGDVVPKLLEVRAKSGVPVKFHLQIEVGDGKKTPPEDVAKQINTLLQNAKDGLSLK